MPDQNNINYPDTLTAFKIRGLYGGTLTLLAEDADDAKRLYHLHVPGWNGVVFKVTEADEETTLRMREELRGEIAHRLVEVELADSVVGTEINWGGDL